MSSQIFLISFSNNRQVITTERYEDYDKLIHEIVQATNHQIEATDIDSLQYEDVFGNRNITITVRNSKALARVPKKEFYSLKCITNLHDVDNKFFNHPLAMMNNSVQTIQKSIPNEQVEITAEKIVYKLRGLTKRRDSLSRKYIKCFVDKF